MTGNYIPLVTMYHYVGKAEAAMQIAETRKLIPSQDVFNNIAMLSDGDAEMPRVNLTDVGPESGRERISMVTGLRNSEVGYCVQVRVNPLIVLPSYHGNPGTYQVFGLKPVPVIVDRILKMSKVDRRGIEIIICNNLPMPYYLTSAA